MKKAQVAVARKMAVILHCIWVDETSSNGASQDGLTALTRPWPGLPGWRCPAGTVVAVTSFDRLEADVALRCVR